MDVVTAVVATEVVVALGVVTAVVVVSDRNFFPAISTLTVVVVCTSIASVDGIADDRGLTAIAVVWS
jgi:hypothetical protein